MTATQIAGAVLLSLGLIAGLWWLAGWLTSYNARIIVAVKPTIVTFPPRPTWWGRDIQDSGDGLYDTSPRHLAEIFGERTRDWMARGIDPYHPAFMAAHYARRADPTLTPAPSSIVRVESRAFPGGERRILHVERIH